MPAAALMNLFFLLGMFTFAVRPRERLQVACRRLGQAAGCWSPSRISALLRACHNHSTARLPLPSDPHRYCLRGDQEQASKEDCPRIDAYCHCAWEAASPVGLRPPRLPPCLSCSVLSLLQLEVCADRKLCGGPGQSHW